MCVLHVEGYLYIAMGRREIFGDVRDVICVEDIKYRTICMHCLPMMVQQLSVMSPVKETLAHIMLSDL